MKSCQKFLPEKESCFYIQLIINKVKFWHELSLHIEK